MNNRRSWLFKGLLEHIQIFTACFTRAHVLFGLFFCAFLGNSRIILGKTLIFVALINLRRCWFLRCGLRLSLGFFRWFFSFFLGWLIFFRRFFFRFLLACFFSLFLALLFFQLTLACFFAF